MYRIECDSIGNKKIESDKLYGIQTLRAYENLSFSDQSVARFPEYIKAMALVKKACNEVNYSIKNYNEVIYSAIKESCQEIAEGLHSDSFIVDMLHGGGGIGLNMNVNEVIANRANQLLGYPLGSYSPVSPIEHVNLSQSTADVCHTAARIAIANSYESLKKQLELLVDVINKKAIEFGHIPTIARTCLQDALRINWGDSFSGYFELLERRLQQLTASVDQLRNINLGGTVVGNGSGASAEYRKAIVLVLSDVMHLELRCRPNLFDAAQNSDDLVNVSNQTALLAKALLKISKDLRLLSSGPEAGFNEIGLPETQAGSSFFPGKVNPVIPETMMHCAFQVIGGARATEEVLSQAELNLNVFEGVAYYNILNNFNMLKNSIELFRELCWEGLVVNEQRCLELANGRIPLVVELKERVGYKKAAELTKHCTKQQLVNLLNQ